jgi:hypothetical protein
MSFNQEISSHFWSIQPILVQWSHLVSSQFHTQNEQMHLLSRSFYLNCSIMDTHYFSMISNTLYIVHINNDDNIVIWLVNLDF